MHFLAPICVPWASNSLSKTRHIFCIMCWCMYAYACALERAGLCNTPLAKATGGPFVANDSTWPVKGSVTYCTDNKCKEELRKSGKLSL